MSRRTLPRVVPADLRDHADEARVERIWDRVEQDLPALAPRPGRSPGFAYLAIAAAFAAFGGGLFLGKVAFHDRAPTTAAVEASPERVAVDVLAAGTEGRTFTLPGGGQLMLQPGATVELERVGEGQVTLKLVQGEASIDTAHAQRTAGLLIVAGEARLNTQAGSVLDVRRGQDDLDVNVRDGSVNLTAPDGSRKLGRGEHADAVPIHGTTAAVSPTSSPLARAPLLAHGRRPDPRGGKPAAVAGPEWLTRYNGNDYAGALALLRQQPGGLDGAIGAAKSADELMAIGTAARTKGGDPGAALKAFTRLLDRFPESEQAQVAAYTMARMFEKSGNAEQARLYLEQAGKLSGPLVEDAVCKRIRGEDESGNKDEAIRQSKEYLAKYPDGRCKDEMERIAASDGAASGPAPRKDPAPAPSDSPSADAPAQRAPGGGGAP